MHSPLIVLVTGMVVDAVRKGATLQRIVATANGTRFTSSDSELSAWDRGLTCRAGRVREWAPG